MDFFAFSISANCFFAERKSIEVAMTAFILFLIGDRLQ